MIRFLRYRLNLKIFASFLLVILVTAFGSLLLGYRVIRKTVEREIAVRLSAGMDAYVQEIRLLEQTCFTIAEEISREESIARLLAAGEYGALERRLVHYSRMGIFDIIEIEDTDGKVILRGHHPAMSGDVKTHQPIIRQGLMGMSTVSYEQGQSGLAVRAVAPIRAEGRVIGLLMIGSLFSKGLTDHIMRLTGMDSGIYRESGKLVATYPGLDRLPDPVTERLRRAERVLLTPAAVGDASSYLLLEPLFLNDGSYWGAFSLRIARREEDRYLSDSRTLFLLVVCVGAGLALVIYMLLARNINHSLAKILAGMNGFNLNRFNTRIELSSRDEFRAIAESFNRLAGKLALYHRRIAELQENMIKSAKLATAGQMAAGLAHEIRNPLSSIKMMTQIIRSRYLRESGQKELGTILNETDRINNLVRELLEFARPSPMHFTRQDANRIITGVLDLFRYNIEHQKIEVAARLNPQLPSPLLDGEKFRLVAMNIVLNAIQAMPEGGTLWVESRNLRDHQVLFSFCNSGPPIAPEDRKNIFEPFFTTKKEGTGLGLALSRTIVERHFGRIRVSSTAGRTCFRVVLPLNPQEQSLLP
jgi:signal transduction histidine kinase